MKKAKEPGEFTNKATDFLSVLKNFTSFKKSPDTDSEPKSSQENNSLNSKQPPSDDYKRPDSIPAPNDYGTNMFSSIIEKHDKAVKKIILTHKKEE